MCCNVSATFFPFAKTSSLLKALAYDIENNLNPQPSTSKAASPMPPPPSPPPKPQPQPQPQQNEAKDKQKESAKNNMCIKYHDISCISGEVCKFLKPVLLSEVKQIFKKHDILFLKNTPSTPITKGVFGTDLSILYQKDIVQDKAKVPIIIRLLVHDLNVRAVKEKNVLHSFATEEEISMLRRKIERDFYKDAFAVRKHIQEASPHLVGYALKTLLESLPDPIFTKELIVPFYWTSFIPDDKDRINAIKYLILSLPTENQNTCRAIFNLINKIVDKRIVTRTSIFRGCAYMANAFFPEDLILELDEQYLSEQSEREIVRHGHSISTTLLTRLVRQRGDLWQVPAYLVDTALYLLGLNSS